MSPTRVAFREFIELADLSTIRIFITTASSSPEGENLKLLWGRAFKEGLISGHQLYGKTEERMKEVHAEAYEEGFQAGYNKGRRDEHGDWALDGHGMHCSYQAIPFDDYETQPVTQPDLTTTKSISVQTHPTTMLQTSYSTSSTQTSTLHTTGHPTTDSFVQTNPICTQTHCHIKPPTSSLSTAMQTSPLAPLTSLGTQTETRMSQHSVKGSLCYLATSPHLELPGNRKNAKFQSSSEISPNFASFSSQTPSPIVSDSQTPSTTTPSLETRQKTAVFTPKVEKVGNS